MATVDKLATDNWKINQPIYDAGEVHKRLYDGYEVEAGAVFVKMLVNGSEPTTERKVIINQLIKDLKGVGNTGEDNVFALLDSIQVYAAADQIQSLVDLRQPFVVLPSIYGETIFTTDDKYKGTGINTGFQPATHNINYSLNSASFGVLTGSDNQAQQYLVGIDENPNRAWIRSDVNGGTIDGSINGQLVQVPGGYTADYQNAFITHIRSNSSEFKTYHGDELQGTTSSVSTFVPRTYTFLTNGINRAAPAANSTASTRIFYAGGDISAYMAQLVNSFNAYINAL